MPPSKQMVEDIDEALEHEDPDAEADAANEAREAPPPPEQ